MSFRMDEYGASTYGDRVADVYDEWFPTDDSVEAAVETLAELAGDQPALELAIGTGRIAIPLAARRVDVRGIDASEAMVARLRAKPGGRGIPVTIGDFADVDVDGPFGLVFIVFNTLFALLSQEDQLRCFHAVADRLTPGGAFVVEAFVPDPTRYSHGQRVSASRVGVDDVWLEVGSHDAATQRIDSSRVVIGAAGVRTYPVRLRYAWPSELDLMARLAGLRLRARWGGWRREPFDSASTSHVSVWERAA